ncbi:XRE family transcriptional regulator [Lactobacillus delbrueckii]|uniref:LexA family transcriptional regulator n=1 Tax=Lactobacillus delbrueckii TaxID=1584 RepID=UPI0023E3F1B4|nr:XRE family transcriptional regulator [Lactobacillus delbrueckii]MDF4030100.1 XRE family transcriptional regulator [Lactobacillus delbrueckii]
MPRSGLTPQEKDLKPIIASTLNDLLLTSGKKKVDIHRSCGIPASTLSDYFAGRTLPTPENVDKLAKFFRVSKEEIDPRFATLPPNLTPVDQSHLVEIPLIGHIACGEPITADQNIEGYITEYFPESVDPDSVFALKCEGDSMEPYILDGDIAYIRQQPDVEDGEIAAVLVDGDTKATLKRVKKVGDQVFLLPDNPRYSPIVLDHDHPGKIIGKMIKMSRFQ